MTLRLRDMLLGLRSLGLQDAPVLMHASLSAFGTVEDGAETVVNALKTVFPILLAPAFTYKTMVTPLTGPPDNGLQYDSATDQNLMAEFFTPAMPVDPLIGSIPEAFRLQSRTRRSRHPILSFCGFNAAKFIDEQTLDEPFAPIGMMVDAGGWVLLMGVNHTVNTSIHHAERLASRRSFTRWALTPEGIVECPNFPGCSAGFDAITPDLERYTRKVKIGEALVQAIPVRMLSKVVITCLKKDPLALLCQSQDCGRCNDVRRSVQRGAQT